MFAWRSRCNAQLRACPAVWSQFGPLSTLAATTRCSPKGYFRVANRRIGCYPCRVRAAGCRAGLAPSRVAELQRWMPDRVSAAAGAPQALHRAPADVGRLTMR
jgi:hypothetical protein